MPTIELKLPRARLPRPLANTIERLPGRPPADVRSTGVDLKGLQEIARRVPTPAVSNLEMPKVDLSKIDVGKIEMPRIDLSKVEVPESIVDRLPTQLADRLPKRRRSRVRLWLLAAAGIVAATVAVVASWSTIRARLSRTVSSDEVGSDPLPSETPDAIWGATTESPATATADTINEPAGSQPSAENPSIDRPGPVTPGQAGERTDQPIGVGVMEEQHSNGAVRS